MSRKQIERINPDTLPVSDLLESQQQLFTMNTVVGWRDSHVQSEASLAHISELLWLYEDVGLEDEQYLEDMRRYFEINRTAQRLADIGRATISVVNTHRDWDGLNRAWANMQPHHPTRYFTPEGVVDNPSGDFQEKTVLITAVGGDYRGGVLGLYTNNLSVSVPRWEYAKSYPNNNGLGYYVLSDILPSRRLRDPYYMQLVPRSIPSEDIARQAVGLVDSILRDKE